MEKAYIYLDDLRTPVDKIWVVVRSYDEFVSTATAIGFENIELVSLDHDLGEASMKDWAINQHKGNLVVDYDTIHSTGEKTGMDCAKWIVEQWLNKAPVFKVMIHSANAVGSVNMMSYINNYYSTEDLPDLCHRWVVPHTMETQIED
jgi:hypothetical protein